MEQLIFTDQLSDKAASWVHDMAAQNGISCNELSPNSLIKITVIYSVIQGLFDPHGNLFLKCLDLFPAILAPASFGPACKINAQACLLDSHHSMSSGQLCNLVQTNLSDCVLSLEQKCVSVTILFCFPPPTGSFLSFSLSFLIPSLSFLSVFWDLGCHYGLPLCEFLQGLKPSVPL